MGAGLGTGLNAGVGARTRKARSASKLLGYDSDAAASSVSGDRPAHHDILPQLPHAAKSPSLDRLEPQPAHAEEDKAVAKSAALAARSVVAAAPEVPMAAPASTSFGSRMVAERSGGKGKTIALVGVGLAAAAGAVLYFAMSPKSETKAPGYQAKALAPMPTMHAPMLDKMPPPPAPEPAKVEVVTPPPAAAQEPEKVAKDVEPKKVHRVEIRDTPKATKSEVVKAAVVKDDKKKDPDAGDPSFDALLKEAGVSDQKKVTKPTLDKKSLTGGDFKTGMGAISGKAQACFAGTQGTAAVKLTIAPSGQVAKASVTGVFAGTPVASCVESAVKSAMFPPWDGGPQTFSYSFLLSD